MTTTTDAPSGSTHSHPAPRNKPGFHWAFFGLLIVAAVAILFLAGVFKRNPRIALIAGESAYWDLVINGANEAAKQYDVKLTVVRSKPDETSQSQMIRDLIGKKYDGIAVSPVAPETQVVLLSELANDTTVVTVDSDSPLSRRLCFVGTDNYTAGRLCGEYVRRAVPDGGEVIISISNLDKENGQRRRQGVIDELLDRPFEREHPMDPPDAPALKGEKYTVVTTLIDHADAAAATEMLTKALAANPDAKCVVGLNSYSAPSAL